MIISRNFTADPPQPNYLAPQVPALSALLRLFYFSSSLRRPALAFLPVLRSLSLEFLRYSKNRPRHSSALHKPHYSQVCNVTASLRKSEHRISRIDSRGNLFKSLWIAEGSRFRCITFDLMRRIRAETSHFVPSLPPSYFILIWANKLGKKRKQLLVDRVGGALFLFLSIWYLQSKRALGTHQFFDDNSGDSRLKSGS